MQQSGWMDVDLAVKMSYRFIPSGAKPTQPNPRSFMSSQLKHLQVVSRSSLIKAFLKIAQTRERTWPPVLNLNRDFLIQHFGPNRKVLRRGLVRAC